MHRAVPDSRQKCSIAVWINTGDRDANVPSSGRPPIVLLRDARFRVGRLVLARELFYVFVAEFHKLGLRRHLFAGRLDGNAPPPAYGPAKGGPTWGGAAAGGIMTGGTRFAMRLLLTKA